MWYREAFRELEGQNGHERLRQQFTRVDLDYAPDFISSFVTRMVIDSTASSIRDVIAFNFERISL